MKSDGSSSSAWTRKSRRGFAAAVGVLVALLAVACGGVPKTYFYMLRTPSPPAANDPKTGYVLGVERFRAPQSLRDNRIVYFESPTEMNYYQYHRWGADPATMLSEYTAQWIEATGVFAQVRLLPMREPVDYTLAGRALSFEEVDYEGGVKGRVSLELTLVRARDRKVVWSARRQVDTPAEEKGMVGVANALNTSSERLLNEVLPGLVAQVEQDYRADHGQSQ